MCACACVYVCACARTCHHLSIHFRIEDININLYQTGDFLPDDPIKLINNASYLTSIGFDKVDVLTGINNNEGAANVPPASLLTSGTK